jgi:hypothetical protein
MPFMQLQGGTHAEHADKVTGEVFLFLGCDLETFSGY